MTNDTSTMASDVLSPALASVTGWLARQGFALLAALPTGPDAAVILVDRSPAYPHAGPGFDRYVTWRAYAHQPEPESGYYTPSFANAMRDLASRSGIACWPV
jgi:hypothetical protein